MKRGRVATSFNSFVAPTVDAVDIDTPTIYSGYTKRVSLDLTRDYDPLYEKYEGAHNQGCIWEARLTDDPRGSEVIYTRADMFAPRIYPEFFMGLDFHPE